MDKRAFLKASFAVGVAARMTPALAQTYPTRPIKLITPYVAGSPVDVFARVLFQHVSQRLGQPIVIENRAGAGTTIGSKAVAIAPPDGYTLLLAGQALAFINYLYPNLDIDAVKSFASIGTLAGWSHIMIITPKLPVKTIGEFVQYAKANPGKLSFGFGLGTAPQILGEYFKVIAGIDVLSVPYKGGENARQDLLAGQIDMNFVPIGNAMPLIEEKLIRPLAITGSKRDALLPDVPSMAESGYPQVGFDPDTWLAASVPAGTPDAIIRRLNRAFNESLMSAEIRAALAKLGMTPMPSTPEEMDTFLAGQIKSWPSVLKIAKVDPQ